jgi:hypothetical protein
MYANRETVRVASISQRGAEFTRRFGSPEREPPIGITADVETGAGLD